jgi:hypothetical protein
MGGKLMIIARPGEANIKETAGTLYKTEADFIRILYD